MRINIYFDIEAINKNFISKLLKLLKMSQYTSIIRGLDASRKIGSELNLDQHKQDLERTKL